MKNKIQLLQAIENLIENGNYVLKEHDRGNIYELDGEDFAFLLSVENIIKAIYRNDTILQMVPVEEYQENRLRRHIEYYLGALQAAKHAIEHGYLQKQELAIAGSVFDSTLVQAKELLEKKYKDPAAILGRVVVEDALRRLANNNDIAIVNETGNNKKASILNDELKKKEFYGQVQWRRVQTWLDIGNEAAHGNFDKVREKDVESLLKDVELFIEEYFGDRG